MRIDWYTKGVLTVIALLIAVIAVRPYVSPDSVVQAQGPFAGVQFAGSGLSFFDPKTGEVWEYKLEGSPHRHRLAKLGAPFVEVK